MRFMTIVVIALALLTLASEDSCSVQADLVVNWGGGYVANDAQNLAGNILLGNDGVNGYSGTAFSASTPFSPPVSGAYTGSSARFYGGAILVHENDISSGDAFENARIKNQGGNDSVQLKATQSGHNHSMHANFLWNQPDFLTGNNPVTFNASTTASVTLGQSSTETLNNASLRLLVRDLANNYWLSEHFFTGLSNNGTYVWDSSNQGFAASTDGKWAAYDPTKELAMLGAGTDLHFDLGTATFVDKHFTGVNGIGFLFEQDNFHNNLEFHWENFSVNAVPEPNGILTFVIALVTGLSRRARRTNQQA